MFNVVHQFAVTKDRVTKKGLGIAENISTFILLLQYMVLYTAGNIVKRIC